MCSENKKQKQRTKKRRTKQDSKTDDGSIFVMYMPPNVTPLIQPMDQNTIRITKLYYRQTLLRVAIGKKDITQYLKSLTIKDAIYLFVLAWDLLKPDVIEKCWHRIFEVDIDDGDEIIPLSLLRQKIIQERSAEVNDLQELLQIVAPEVRLKICLICGKANALISFSV